MQFCDTETSLCGDVVTACLPTCRGDFDCVSGEYCDYLGGACVPGERTGLDLGEACDAEATTDACGGFCSAVDAEGGGVCSGFCTFHPDFTGWGWDGTGAAEAACLFGTRLSPPDDLAAGDVGICGSLCDCNDDCKASAERCMEDPDGVIPELFGRPGYCRPLADDETDADSLACD